MCVSLLLRRFLKRCSHERTTVFLERENRGEREREREREKERDRLRIRIIFALIKALFRFPGNSSLSLCKTHECLLALLQMVFSRWSRRKKERECAEEEENDFKNKRDDTEHRL